MACINSNIWRLLILNSKALIKTQSLVIITIIVVAAVGGTAAYVLWNGPISSTDTIKIGIIGDLDHDTGKNVWQAAILAAEQINAEGGVLGRNFTIVAEDDDAYGRHDIAVAMNAFTKLIIVDEADFILDSNSESQYVFPKQDLLAEHNKILISTRATNEDFTQRVLDDYEKYKYYFRAWFNDTSSSTGISDGVITLGNYSGFTKVAILAVDTVAVKRMASEMNSILPQHGFEIVYNGVVAPSVTDFTSYFAAIEESGAQILNPILGRSQSFPFIREYADRQSPLVIWGSYNSAIDFWNLTEGKAEYTTNTGVPITAGYPLTSKTLPAREAYIDRWGEIPIRGAVSAYDVVRFILPDAINRAGTTETEAVIKALEKTDIETSLARRFVFTSSHDTMVGGGQINRPDLDYMMACKFQWQNGTLVPVYPKSLMMETGATYIFPPWQGPWD